MASSIRDALESAVSAEEAKQSSIAEAPVEEVAPVEAVGAKNQAGIREDFDRAAIR